MERKNAWKEYSKKQVKQLDNLAADYIDFISNNKTERECASTAIKEAEKCGYESLENVIKKGKKLKSGSKVWAHTHNKAVMLVHLGKDPLEGGFNILGAHIDSPRLDLKQNPLYEANDFSLLDTHYYGGIKKYQWVSMPLAMHGVIAKTDGTTFNFVIGEDEADPVFCITDLLPHLGAEQMKKKGSEVIEGEALDILVGNRPLVIESSKNKKGKKDAASDKEDVSDKEDKKGKKGLDWEEQLEKNPVNACVLKILQEKYGIAEEDFTSAEIEIVPAGRAREMGFDRSMVLGYGQDDRVCAYTSLRAQLEIDTPKRTAITLLVDKEEIGSVGATGMASRFFENTLAEIFALTDASYKVDGKLGDKAGKSDKGAASKAADATCASINDNLSLRRALKNSFMLSSDVSAGFDPSYSNVFETKNAAYLGRGLVFNKYTGARGKSGSNDASAEYVARVRRVMNDAKVFWQTAELGKVDVGGGGTIAYIPAKYDMDVIDSGVSVLSMHAPWEVTSKADIYEAYRGYLAFLKNM